MKQYPTVFSTADVLVYDKHGNILLGQKEKDGAKYRIPGGFTDPGLDTCYLDTAIREATEELSFDFSDLEHEFVYLGDFEVEDARYKDTPHTIFTNLYVVQVDDLSVFEAGDDLKKTTVIDFATISSNWGLEEHVIVEHQKLVKVFINFFNHAFHGDTSTY